MTKLTIHGTSAHFAQQEDRPEGSIRHVDEIRDYPAYPVVVHTVAQSGYIETYSIVETCHVAKFVWHDGGMSNGFLIATQQRTPNDPVRVAQFYLEQYGITDSEQPSQQAFQAFFNLEQAQAYSEHMQKDAAYMESVERWYEHCRSWDEYVDYYDYDDCNDYND